MSAHRDRAETGGTTTGCCCRTSRRNRPGRGHRADEPGLVRPPRGHAVRRRTAVRSTGRPAPSVPKTAVMPYDVLCWRPQYGCSPAIDGLVGTSHVVPFRTSTCTAIIDQARTPVASRSSAAAARSGGGPGSRARPAVTLLHVREHLMNASSTPVRARPAPDVGALGVDVIHERAHDRRPRRRVDARRRTQGGRRSGRAGVWRASRGRLARDAGLVVDRASSSTTSCAPSATSGSTRSVNAQHDGRCTAWSRRRGAGPGARRRADGRTRRTAARAQ